MLVSQFNSGVIPANDFKDLSQRKAYRPYSTSGLAKKECLDDAASLRLLVQKNGTKCWRFNYRYQSKQKTLAIGVYPEIGLKKAREMLVSAKKLLSDGIDPSQEKQRQKRQNIRVSQNDFEQVAKEWWEYQRGTWTEDHANRVCSRLKDNTFTELGLIEINELHPQDIIAVIRKIEKRGGLDVAQRVLQDVHRIFKYFVQTGMLKSNLFNDVAPDILRTAKCHTVHHCPANNY